MRLPFTYQFDELTMNCLRIKGDGATVEEALASMLQNNPEFYSALKAAQIASDSHTGKMYVTVPFSQKLYDKICSYEPLGKEKEVKKKENKSGLKQATAEDTLNYGY